MRQSTSASWHQTTHGSTAQSTFSSHPKTGGNGPRPLAGQDLLPKLQRVSQSRSGYQENLDELRYVRQDGSRSFAGSGLDASPDGGSRTSQVASVVNKSSEPVDGALNVTGLSQASTSKLFTDEPVGHHHPKKRARPNEGRMAYPRKRAITACQLCRLRKTKCDNQRPSCSSCSQVQVACVYQDSGSDLSSFDPASLAILERLNYAIQLIENQKQILNNAELLTSLQLQSHPSVDSVESAGLPFPGSAQLREALGVSVDQSPFYDYLANNNSTTLGEALDVAAHCSSSHILNWPIFENKFNASDITSLFFDPEFPQDGQQASRRIQISQTVVPFNRSSIPCQGIREEDTVALVQDFLKNVHVKNPILDPQYLRSIARSTSENGFGWDGPACLVLIACALANLSAPFSTNAPEKGDVSYVDARDYSTAEAYYTASRKRIGLLGISVLSTQCYFWTGVYEMYSLRPLRAWLSFNRACTTFQAYLRTQSHHLTNNPTSRRLEQRLYWSCLKSECEMRDEIDLPPTGLAKVEYPDIFPSPPGGTPVPEDNSSTTPSSSMEDDLQRSWYYYLSEIASRRIANRTTHALHKTGPQRWSEMPLKRLVRIVEELDAQLVQWKQHIPPQLTSEDEPSSDELTFMLHARYLDIRERVWRPFLYLAIHHEFDEADQSVVSNHARKWLDIIINYITCAAIKHRHHGSWYGVRQLFTTAVLLLAVIKSKRLEIPFNWRSLLDLVLTCLQYWESEAPDLQAARLTLEDMLDDLDQSV